MVNVLFLCNWKHPGGGELIADVAGRDCTNEFDDFGHSSDAKNQLKDLKIGELVQVINKFQHRIAIVCDCVFANVLIEL